MAISLYEPGQRVYVGGDAEFNKRVDGAHRMPPLGLHPRCVRQRTDAMPHLRHRCAPLIISDSMLWSPRWVAGITFSAKQ